MSEDYRIVSRARGEPLPAGSVGVRVHVQLSGSPSQRWARELGACLVHELLGHTAVGHLQVNTNDIVQGNEIVLEGVEATEAPSLAQSLQRAVDGANRANTDTPSPSPNVSQQEADDIAGSITLGEPDGS